MGQLHGFGWSAAVAVCLAAGTATAAPMPAREADALVDTIGVNIHLHYTGGVYDTGFDAIIAPKLAALKIRHVRDGAYTYPEASADSFYYVRARALAALGIRFDLLTSMDTKNGDTTDFDRLADVFAWCDGAVASFEGVNEPNIQGVADWIAQTKAVQESLYATVKGDAALAEVLVLGPSPVLGGAFDLGDVSAWLDRGNAHPYPGGECPTCGDVYGKTLEGFMPEFTLPSGDKPLVMTETGYHNAIHTMNNHRPASELAAGKYMPRLFLEYFNRGFARTYSYELIDQGEDPEKTDPEANFGLLRRDGSEKPAYVAVQSLIGLLEDPGPAFDAGTLDVELAGELERVHSTLLQKRDGRFYLALWLERSSYDTGARPNLPDDYDARGDLEVAPQAVQVTLGQRFAGAVLHEFTDAGTIAAQPVDAPEALDVVVRDRLLVIELVPAEEPDATTGDATTGDPTTGDATTGDATTGGDATGEAPTTGGGGSQGATTDAGDDEGSLGHESATGDVLPGGDEEDAEGCGCRSDAPGGWTALLGLLAPLARRRRR